MTAKGVKDMQRKRFLALMLTATLFGQSVTVMPVMASSENTEEIEDFASGLEPEENEIPVISEDLPEETVTYYLNEEAEPLKIRTENEEYLKYLWLKSEDNENFQEIKKSDTEKTDQEEKQEDQENQSEKTEEYETEAEYAPPTDIAGTFYYKVRVWNADETDENAYIESRTVCIQVLEEEPGDNDSTDSADGQEEQLESPDESESAAENKETSEAENPSTVEDYTEDAANEDTDADATEELAAPESDSAGNDVNIDEDNAENNSADDENEETAESLDYVNHLPVRQENIPENETYETEGYWNVLLDEIFRDPDGDQMTYYERGERDEEWTQIDGNSYLCHLKENQETYIFTAKDQEGYGEIYAITLTKKNDSQEEQTETYAMDSEEDFSAGEAEVASSQKVNFAVTYKATGEYLASMAEKSAPENASIYGEWMIIGLKRSGQPVDSSVYNRYLSNVVNTVKEKQGILHAKKYSEYSRTILGLTAIGEDVTDVGGYNLLQPLSDFDQTIWQGVNGTIWALIAFDSHDYEIPEAEEGKNQTTREKLIDDILKNEVSGGGWSIFGGADSDMTGMALQALAPYYNSNASVKAAVDRAVSKLSSMQLSDGTFGTMGHSTSESCSQVVAGLSAMGIDCDKDSRFIKNGNSLLQGLLSYYTGEGGFRHVMSSGYDQMATEQAYYAMTAYSRMKNGQNSLYDMTDIAIKSDREKASEVIKLIEALPEEITMNNFQQVITAYAAYNGLNSAQKSVITKEDQEKLLKAYKAAQEVEIKNVEKLIAGIGKVTLKSEEKITDAKIAYNSLPEDKKKKVSNYSILVAAEKELQKLKKESEPTSTPGKPSKPEKTPTPDSKPTADPTEKPSKPSGKPGQSVNMVTPTPTQPPKSKKTPEPTPGQSQKPAKTPAPTPGQASKPTKTPTPSPTSGANPSRTKSAGGSTKSVSSGGKISSKKSSSAAGNTKTADGKSKSSREKENTKNKKTASKTSTSEVKATKTTASEKVVSEMKAFFDKKRKNPYPSKVDDYTEKQIKEIGKTWKNYEKLSAGEKKAVQKNQTYKAFRKLLTSLGEKYHFDQATGTNLADNKEDALPWYVQMVVNPKIADENEIKTIQKVLGEESEVLSLNEIQFVDTLTGDSWKPKDILNVQLPMADLGDYKSCMIVHITDKGKVEFLKGKVSDSYITFDAAEFSAYGIVGFMGDSNEILSDQEKKKSVWPLIVGGGAALLLVVILGGVQLADSRKAKAASGKKKDKSEK